MTLAGMSRWHADNSMLITSDHCIPVQNTSDLSVTQDRIFYCVVSGDSFA